MSSFTKISIFSSGALLTDTRGTWSKHLFALSTYREIEHFKFQISPERTLAMCSFDNTIHNTHTVCRFQ